jgi:hypothetical protein
MFIRSHILKFGDIKAALLFFQKRGGNFIKQRLFNGHFSYRLFRDGRDACLHASRVLSIKWWKLEFLQSHFKDQLCSYLDKPCTARATLLIRGWGLLIGFFVGQIAASCDMFAIAAICNISIVKVLLYQ